MRKLALETTLEREGEIGRFRKSAEMYELKEWTHKPSAEQPPCDLREGSRTLACCIHASAVSLEYLQEPPKD